MNERTILSSGGDVVTVRPLTSADADAVVAGYQQLSPASIRQRFFTPRISHLGPRFLADLATERDDHVVLLAFERSGTLVGEARGILDATRPTSAELALTVGDRWQGRGIGSALWDLLAADLRAAGIHRLRGHTQTDNHRARALLSRRSAIVWVDEPGVLGFEILLEPGAVPSEESFYRALGVAS